MATTNNNSQLRLAGIANISVGGKSYLLAGDLSWSAADVERTSLTGLDDVHGYKEMPHANFIAATFRDVGNLSVKDFNNMTSANITANLANGKTITGSNMWCVNAQEVKSTEGTFEVRFEGVTGSVTEQLTS